ncbi:MAG: DUF5985 family protein [Kofleriaceae bacterium]
MAELVYLLCALTSLCCAGLLARSYARQRSGLMLASTLCFVGLTVNNALLFIDLVLVPEIDMSMARTATALIAMLLLVIGLIWEAS